MTLFEYTVAEYNIITIFLLWSRKMQQQLLYSTSVMTNVTERVYIVLFFLSPHVRWPSLGWLLSLITVQKSLPCVLF